SCETELSECYAFERFSLDGEEFCRRWQVGSYDNLYTEDGTVLPDGITKEDVKAAALAAIGTWKAQEPNLPNLGWVGYEHPAFTSDVSNSITHSTIVFYDQYDWPSSGVYLTAEGVTTSTWDEASNPNDKTITHGFTQLRWDPYRHWWNTNCSSGCESGYDLDLTGMLTHELGHYWRLLDVNAGSCIAATMYGSIVGTEYSARDLFVDDMNGIN